MTEPTKDQAQQWARYKNKVRIKTIPTVKAAIQLGYIALDAQKKIYELTSSLPDIVTTQDESILNSLGLRSEILNRQISKVALQKYGVQFVEGDINIVSWTQNEKDQYPSDEIQMGIAPFIIVAGIAAFTLLVAGDQAADRLETKAKLEAVRLQKKMLAADKYMITQPAPVRASWTKWKDQAAIKTKEALKNLSVDKSFMEKFLGKGPTMGLIIGGLVIAGLLIAPPKLKRGL